MHPSATVTPAAAGNVTLTLPTGMAQDAAGNLNIASNTLTVAYAPAPVPQVVKIQAEDFDEGGEGVAYHDTDVANIGQQSSGLNYRSTGVDIEPSEDTDGTPSIGWIAAGEWLRYTTALSSGTYDINVRMATVFAGPSKMRILINGTLATTFDITATGGWSAWRTFKVSGINIASTGPATIRVEFPDGAVNFNWIEFVNTVTVPDTTPPTVTLATASTNVSAPFTVSATFSQPVTGVALNDFIVTNGTASALSGSGAVYSVTITPAAEGVVTVRVPAVAAANSTGQGNTVSNLLTVNYTAPDTTPPAVVLSTPSTAVTSVFVVTVTFNESVTGLLAAEFVITNGTVTALSAAGAVWSATVTPAVAGDVTVRLPAGMAQDAAGNGNTASNLITVSYTPLIVSNGLTADYYNGKNFEQLVLRRTDPNIDFTWSGSPASGLPADAFSVRWQGSIIPTSSGVFDFITRSDDGVRLWLNGVLVVNNWSNHGETWDYATLNLTAGVPVTVQMEFYENTGGAMARLFWDGPGTNFVAIPSSALRPLSGGGGSGSSPALASAAASSASSIRQALGIASSSGIIRPEEGLQLRMRDQNAIDATLVRPAGQSGVTFTLESTADLVNWTALAVTPTIVSLGNGWERVTWSNLHALSG